MNDYLDFGRIIFFGNALTNVVAIEKCFRLGILSKSKGEATRCIDCLHQNHQAELPRPYATLKFEEDTRLVQYVPVVQWRYATQ